MDFCQNFTDIAPQPRARVKKKEKDLAPEKKKTKPSVPIAPAKKLLPTTQAFFTKKGTFRAASKSDRRSASKSDRKSASKSDRKSAPKSAPKSASKSASKSTRECDRKF